MTTHHHLEPRTGEPVGPGDVRRAAALVAHHVGQRLGHGDATDGLNAVIDEANELDRTSELLEAVLDLVVEVAPVLTTLATLAVLRQVATGAAQREGQQ